MSSVIRVNKIEANFETTRILAKKVSLDCKVEYLNISM